MKKNLLNICYTYVFNAALTASLAALLFVSVPSSECWGALTKEERHQINAANDFLAKVFYNGKNFNRTPTVAPSIEEINKMHAGTNKQPRGRIAKGLELMYEYVKNPKDLESIRELSKEDILFLKAAQEVLIDARYMTPKVVDCLGKLEDNYKIKIPTDQIPNYPKITADSSTEVPPQSKKEDSKDSKGEDSKGNGEAFKVVGQDGEGAKLPTGTSGVPGAAQETAQLNIEYIIDPLSSIEILEGENVDFTNVWKESFPTKAVKVQVTTNVSQGVTLKVSSAGLTNGTDIIPCFVGKGTKTYKLGPFGFGEVLLEGVQTEKVSLDLSLEKGQKTFSAGTYKGTITLEISGQA